MRRYTNVPKITFERVSRFTETKSSPGGQSWYSLGTLKPSFNVSSEYQGCQHDELSVSVYTGQHSQGKNTFQEAYRRPRFTLFIDFYRPNWSAILCCHRCHWKLWVNISHGCTKTHNITTTKQSRTCRCAYQKTSNISHTLVGNKIVDDSCVVGTSPVGAALITSSFST